MNSYPYDRLMLNVLPSVCVPACMHVCMSPYVCRRACESDCEEEGEVCNHLIQTYTRGISLLDLTVPFEPYLVSISRLSFGARCRNLIPFVLKSLLSEVSCLSCPSPSFTANGILKSPSTVEESDFSGSKKKKKLLLVIQLASSGV